MNNIETRILNYGKNIDMNLENISKKVDEIQKLINAFPSNAEFISVYDDEDDEDDFDDGVWIEFPFTESE